MKLTLNNGAELRWAMQAVRTMGLQRSEPASKAACRVRVDAERRDAEVTMLVRHAALAMGIEITGDAESGEVTLPASAVRTICNGPARGPVMIETNGGTIRVQMGESAREATFDAASGGHEGAACRRILDGDYRETSGKLDAGEAGELLHRIGHGQETCRIRMSEVGIEAWAATTRTIDRQADAMLSRTAAKGEQTLFGVSFRLLDEALRAIAAREVTLRAGLDPGGTVELAADGARIAITTTRLQ